MPRYYVGDNVTEQISITENGVLTDPDTLTCHYRVGRQGDISELTPVRDDVGLYTVVVPITQGGVAYHVKWVATGPDRAGRRAIQIERDVFDVTNQADYPLAGSF